MNYYKGNQTSRSLHFVQRDPHKAWVLASLTLYTTRSVSFNETHSGLLIYGMAIEGVQSLHSLNPACDTGKRKKSWHIALTLYYMPINLTDPNI